MKIDITKEWLEKRADLEDDCEVGAGGLCTPWNTLACRKIATWDKFGKAQAYRVRLEESDTIVEHLGMVKLRADGRWGWWRAKSKYHEGWTMGQGVALTEEEAKAKVLEGWT